MRIGYITSGLSKSNGWGRFSSDLISTVESLGHEVTILCESKESPRGLPIIKRGLWGILTSIRPAIKQLRDCDIIHAMDPYPFGVIAYFANFFLKKPLVISLQGTYAVMPFQYPSLKHLARRMLNSASTLISISEYTTERIREYIPKKDIQIIHHGIDYDHFSVEHSPTDPPYLLSVGGVKPRKGYHISIPAFAEARKHIPNLKYKIVGTLGSNDFSNRLRSLIKEHQLEDSVEFHSNISEQALRKLYQQATAFILCSTNEKFHFEGFGLVFLEAAAAGLPLIGTIGNGIASAVSEGKNAILVPQNDVNMTSQAIIDLLSSKEKLTSFSQHSSQWAKEHNLKWMAERYVESYNSLKNN